MRKIVQLTLPDSLEIDLLFENGKLAYTFQYDGKSYGNAVKIPSRSVDDIASACLVLFTNAVETNRELKK